MLRPQRIVVVLKREERDRRGGHVAVIARVAWHRAVGLLRLEQQCDAPSSEVAGTFRRCESGPIPAHRSEAADSLRPTRPKWKKSIVVRRARSSRFQFPLPTVGGRRCTRRRSSAVRSRCQRRSPDRRPCRSRCRCAHRAPTISSTCARALAAHRRGASHRRSFASWPGTWLPTRLRPLRQPNWNLRTATKWRLAIERCHRNPRAPGRPNGFSLAPHRR